MKIVAEAGQCHGGSIRTAIRMVEAAAHAGADAIKFQLLQPETIAQADAPKYWYADGLPTTNQREAFATAGIIPYDAWGDIKAAADMFGVEFLATPFDDAALDTLAGLGCESVKIASGDITYKPFLKRVAETGMDVILSTGASRHAEISRALAWLVPAKVTLLACTLAYPTAVDDANLGRMDALRAIYGPGCRYGYSDHTSSPRVALAAAAMGASVIEVHFTHDRNATGVPDHKIAVDPAGLATYVQFAREGETMRGDGTLAPIAAEVAALVGARRSVCAARDLPADHELSLTDFVYLRPGDGHAPWAAEQLVGLRLREAVAAGELIVWP